MNPLIRKITALGLWALSALLMTLGSSPQARAYELLVSNTPDRSDAVSLAEQTVSGKIYVFLSPATGGISQVRFYLDDPAITHPPRQVENNPPYDFAGGSVTIAKPFGTPTVADGNHTIKAVILLEAGGSQTAEAAFSVANNSSSSQNGFFDQVHLALAEDPSTSIKVVWRTMDTTTASMVRYRKEGATTWQTATGGPRPSGTAGTLHEVTLTGLDAATRYQYQVLGDGSLWSGTFSTRTAPPPGPADFDAVFFADTGLTGRTDGLTTGTRQIINEIAALDPLLVLAGGDYAYFDTDKRYGTLDASIDAWFNQMQPVASRAPMMPAYGNHEALLGENVQSWIKRFPTPEGFDGRRNYSFDIGDVHFVAIFAVQNTTGLNDATLAWIDQDITAAYSAGAHWIVPYFHVAPFSEGTNHPSNLALRRQLGPLFERLNVKLVLTAHDQSYERTYPLVDVPASNTPTSLGKNCYTLGDGVTWVKVSPGGKLSNINRSFSTFATSTPPPWTAFRDNTRHHFSRLRVSAAGTLQLDTYGVKGDGTPPVLMDSFHYTTGSCSSSPPPPPTSHSLKVSAVSNRSGSVALQSATLAGKNYVFIEPDTGITRVSFFLDDPGMTHAPRQIERVKPYDFSGTASNDTALAWNSTQVADGPHAITAKIDKTTGDSEIVSAAFTVTNSAPTTASYSVAVSTVSNRSGAMALQSATLAGIRYVFLSGADGTTAGGSGISKVTFSLDGVQRQVEQHAAYDFSGTAPNGTALAWNTAQVSNGTHTIAAKVAKSSGGSDIVSASFNVNNN